MRIGHITKYNFELSVKFQLLKIISENLDEEGVKRNVCTVFYIFHKQYIVFKKVDKKLRN